MQKIVLTMRLQSKNQNQNQNWSQYRISNMLAELESESELASEL